MRPSLPAPQDPQPAGLLSKFTPHTINNRGRFQGVLSFQIDGFLTGLSWIWDDIQPMNQMGRWALQVVCQNAFRMVLSHQTICPEHFAGSSNIPWNPPTNVRPIPIATISQMTLLYFCELLSQESHLLLNGVGSTRDLHRFCQIPGNCQCQ